MAFESSGASGTVCQGKFLSAKQLLELESNLTIMYADLLTGSNGDCVFHMSNIEILAEYP